MSFRLIIWFFLGTILISSCIRKTTCPAYFSKYILDQDEIQKRFSLFKVDSLPKEGIGFVQKNKFGIIEEKSYRNRYNEIKDIPMLTIYPQIVDSILMVKNVADTSGVDSLGLPIVEPFMRNINYDQIIYNSLFYDLLIPPEEEDIRDELKEETSEQGDEVKNEQPRKKGLGLFRKKDKEPKEEKEILDTPQPQETTPQEEVTDEEEDDGF